MNFGRIQLLFTVMLPQSWKVILPPTVGYLVGFVKSTSIASQVGVLELTYAAKIMNTKGFSAMLCFGTVLILYFAICYPLSLFGGLAERRAGRGDGLSRSRETIRGRSDPMIPPQHAGHAIPRWRDRLPHPRLPASERPLGHRVRGGAPGGRRRHEGHRPDG